MKKSVSPRSLNTDDNKLLLKSTESKFSLNVDSEGFGEDESGVVKHVRGNGPASFSDELMVLPSGVNKVIGSVSDDQLNVVYFFVYNSNSDHSVVAYNSRTNTYRTVFVSSALDFREDGFVKADIVRLRRVPEDQELFTEAPVEPEELTPVELKFRLSVDLSVWGEVEGYSSSESAPSSTSNLPVQFISQGGLRIYNSGEPITDNSPYLQSITKELKASDDEFDGWLKNATVTIFVHPEDVLEAACFLQWKVQSDLGGLIDGDVTRNISHNTILAAMEAGAEGLQLGSPCYGFHKEINDMLVSDLPISGYDASVMNSSSSTGRLLDRMLNFGCGADYSQTSVWESELVSQINTYSGGPFSGSPSPRSYPTAQMDNGGDPGAGFGGGDGGSEVVVITYCNSLEQAQTVGADYGSLAEAIAAWIAETNAGNTATITNLCSDLGAGNGTSTNFTPKVITYDTLSQEVFEEDSLTPVQFDLSLQTIPEDYDFQVSFYLSSCGTMRRQTALAFRSAPDNENIESMSDQIPSNLGMYWGSSNGQGANGYDPGDRVSDVYTSYFSIYGGVQDLLMRVFEVSVNNPSDTSTIYTGATALSGNAVVLFYQNNPYPSVSFLCFGSQSPCSVSSTLPTTIRPVVPDINGDEGTTIISVTGVTETQDRPATQESSTLTSASDEEAIIKAKAEIKKK